VFLCIFHNLGIASGSSRWRFHKSFGEMAEWFMAAVLKTVVGLHLTGGSNPSLSVVISGHTKNATDLSLCLHAV
jgi:hypothetical protein